MDDRALSLVQPWLSGGILRFGKRIENRTGWRSCKHRGPIWLHASATRGSAFSDSAAGLRDVLCAQGRQLDWESFLDESLDVRTVCGEIRYAPTSDVDALAIPMGAIVGHARIVDVITGERDFTRWVEAAPNDRDRTARIAQGQHWWFRGFALVLDDVVEIAPVAAKGALGLWKVPEQIANDARSALRLAMAVRT